MTQTYDETKAKQREYHKRDWERIKNDPILLEQERERLRKWRAAHLESERERSREKYLRTKERHNAKTSEWFKTHREWDNERKRKRYAENRERELQNWARGKYRAILSREELAAIWPRLQHGPCEICGAMRTDESNRGHARMSIDHNHATMKFRGVLCYRCNLAIGHFKENPATLRAAAEYLERQV